jgi:hypothetical protein
MAEFAHCAKHHNQHRITEGCEQCKKEKEGLVPDSNDTLGILQERQKDVQLQGESREEFEHDRFGTAGSFENDNATPVVTEKHVLFLQSKGTNVKSVGGAKKKIASMEEGERRDFFKEASEWIDHNDD